MLRFVKTDVYNNNVLMFVVSPSLLLSSSSILDTTYLSTSLLGLVDGLLLTARPRAKLALANIGVPVTTIGRRIVDIESIRGMHGESRHDANRSLR